MGMRFWGGVGILLVLLVLGIGIGNSMEHTHQAVSADLEQAAQAVLSGEETQGQQFLYKARKTWQQRRFLTAAVADHNPMEEIDSIFSQLESYAASGDQVSFAAWCSRVAKLVEAIGEAHKLTWQNLL